MLKGVHNRILWIDLTKNEIKEEEPGEAVFRKYLGGYGLGVYYIYKRIKPNCNPLGPENIIGFCPGLFTGSPAPVSGRCFICGKSPQTLTWNDSSVGGFIGMAIKRAGYDAIFITGKAEKPVYLFIDDNGPKLEDARALWGKDTIKSENWLKEKYGKSARSACIGPGGENQVLISGIACDGGRMAARGGMGAVLGSKNFKAICTTSRKKLDYENKEAISSFSRDYSSTINDNAKNFGAKMMTKMAPAMGTLARVLKIPLNQNQAVASRVYKEFGTSFAVPLQVSVGDTPVKNFGGIGHLEFPMKVGKSFTTEEMQKWITGNQGCFSCPVQCGHIMKVPELGIEKTHRPEYETLASFGPLLMNEDVMSVVKANEYLNRMGVDTISAGVTLAFVIECCEEEILKKEDFKCNEFPEGFLPGWNKPDTIMPLLKMLVNREAIGDIIANGTARASEKFGPESEKYAMVANRQEIPMHDPRKFHGITVTYLSDPTPGRHTAASLEFHSLGALNNLVDGIEFNMSTQGFRDGNEHARFAMFFQVWNAVGLCEFALYFAKYNLLEMIKGITGWNDFDIDEIFTVGKRIQVLRQMFNAREHAIGFDVAKRAIGIPPLEKGPLKNLTINPKQSIIDYFKTMGFDDKGVPKETTLNQLELEFALNDLEGAAGAQVPDFT